MKVICALFVLLCITSCVTLKEEGNYQFVADNIGIDNGDSGVNQLGKGEVWKAWKRIHNSCMNSPLAKDQEYVGMSNSIRIGTIKDNKYRTLDFLDTTIVSESELKYIMNSGNSASCSTIDSVDFNVQTELGLEFIDFGPELTLAYSNASYNKIVIESWVLDELVIDRLIGTLLSKPNARKKAFARSLTKKKSRIVSNAIIVKSFTIETVFDKESELSFLADTSIVQGSDFSGNIVFNISKNKNNSITLQSKNQFVVFCQFSKIKEVK
jgi:hypothetical protein